MQPSRRDLLRFCGVAGTIAVAGCTDAVPVDAIGGGSGNSGSTDSGSDAEANGDPVADDAPIRATLTVDETRSFFEGRHVETVGPVAEGQSAMPYVSLRLSDEGVEAATEAAIAADLGERYEDAEIAVFVDDEEHDRFGVDEALAASIVDGEWEGTFRMTFTSRESAESFREPLVAKST